MSRNLLSVSLRALAALALATLPLAAQQSDVEARAMKDEMERSMKHLHLESAEGPYFIAYKIVDAERKDARASLGSLTSSGETQSRVLSVTVRVGSYDFDNSNFSGGGLGAMETLLSSITGGANLLPVDDNLDELRRKIWLATDSAYKKALEDLSQKKAAQQNRNREETIPDFSEQPARQEAETLPRIEENLSNAEHLVRQASAVFRTLPMVQTSDAVFEVDNTTEHFLNSEGTSYLRQVPNVVFRATASLQIPNGEIFSDNYSAYGRSLSDLPSEATLVQNCNLVAERLTARSKGKRAKRYNGPVLFEGESAPEIFAHDFANQLSARARSAGTSANALLSELLGAPATPTNSANGMVNKIGSRLLPDFLTVVDNPQLTEADGHPLLGNYKFDEEGVPSSETVLVKDGFLKTLMTSRAPARGMLESTGNMRQRGVLPGNLFVEASKSVSREDLRKQLMDRVSARGLEYGMVIRRLAGNAALEAIRVYPDGHEDAVRDSRIAEVTFSSFKDILAVSKQRTVYTVRSQSLSLPGTGDLISYIVPDLLFEDMTVEHIANDTPKPPVIPSPLDSN
jgi:predicted Zn-dependent protease